MARTVKRSAAARTVTTRQGPSRASQARAKRTIVVPWRGLLDFTALVLEKVGMARHEAEMTADTLVFADLRGIHSHGVMRLPVYVKRIELGAVSGRSEIRVLRQDAATALIDGGNGMGQVASIRAMELCIEKARAHGSAWVGARHSNHNGVEQYYTLMAVRQNMIGIAMTDGAQNVMPPWGGRTRLLGTNPVSIAVPAGKGPPVVLDVAFTVASMGKAVDAMKRGSAIPPGWAINRSGEPTQDPREALEGAFLPIGEHKGCGLALMVSMLCGVLTGAAFGHAVTPFWEDFATPQNVGHLMGAISIERFMDMAEYGERAERIVAEMRGAELAQGFEKILLPGQREFEVEQRYRAEGIPLARGVYDELRELQGRFSITAGLD